MLSSAGGWLLSSAVCSRLRLLAATGGGWRLASAVCSRLRLLAAAGGGCLRGCWLASVADG